MTETMAFEPPTKAQILSAIGSTEELPLQLKRALEPSTDFEPIPIPAPGDWLAVHPESGQTFEDFYRARRNTPDDRRNLIYIQPLGQFAVHHSPALDLLRDCATAYFMVNVTVLPVLSIRRADITSRINPYTGKKQILTAYILRMLRQDLPADAFCVLSVTMEDLYPNPAWNFVFGQASLRHRVGVFSFARYDSAFYGEPRDKNYRKLLLYRSCKVLVHETAHMFSLTHCIYFRCVMNGSNHLQESDSRPLFLCPVCLRKLQSGIGFDVADRYRRLLDFYRKMQFNKEADWVSARLKWITQKND